MFRNRSCAVPRECTYRDTSEHAVALTLKESANRSNWIPLQRCVPPVESGHGKVDVCAVP